MLRIWCTARIAYRNARLRLYRRINPLPLTIPEHADREMVVATRPNAIDPESWASVYQASNMVDGIIRDWNGIGI